MEENGATSRTQLLHVVKTLTDELAIERSAHGETKRQNHTLREQINNLTATVAELTAKVAELTARLASNSSNSSLPPSNDPPGIKPRSLRKKSGRKPGGQTGHTGTTLARVPHPDQVHTHRPPVCRKCRAPFGPDDQPVAVDTRQVFDLPTEIRLEVSEHQIYTLACTRCAARTKADTPQGVPRQVQYGPHVTSLAVYLGNYHHLPLERTSELLADLLGADISPATIQKMTHQAAEVITTTFRPVAEHILTSGHVAHADETGFKVGGKTHWAHSFSNPAATWIQVHPKRGKAAIDDIGILNQFTGTLVHDAWSAYDTYANISAHQLCNAHSQRELQAVIDQHDHPAGQWCWADQAKQATSAIIHDPTSLDDQRPLITSALAIAQTRDPDPPGKVGKKHAALRRRLRARLADYLRFTTDPLIPPTNNPAEQEIRMVKIKQKIVGTMRTLKGANDFTAIRSYLSTARKHAIRPLEALATLTSPNPWLPAPP